MGDISRNFSRVEFECSPTECGCGFDTIDAGLVNILEQVRFKFKQAPVTINSGCRCEAHNFDVGGAVYSKHLKGRAADFVVSGVHADTVADYLIATYPGKYGIGRYNGRTHVDSRDGEARWDSR